VKDFLKRINWLKLFRKIAIVVWYIPTVILWMAFTILFKILGKLNGSGLIWGWLDVEVKDRW